MAFFIFLVIGTYLGAPLSIALAVAALVAIRQRPARLIGRTPAMMAIIMSILLIALVGVAHYKVAKAFEDSDKAVSKSFEAGTKEKANEAKSEVNEVEKLLDDCQLYAREHSGKYPPDASSLLQWIRAKNPAAEPGFGSCVYFGAGLTEQTVAPSQQVPIDSDNPLIVWVRRSEAQNQNYIIGTMPGRRSRVRLVSDLRRYLESCNKERSTLGLPPIYESDILNASPSTRG